MISSAVRADLCRRLARAPVPPLGWRSTGKVHFPLPSTATRSSRGVSRGDPGRNGHRPRHGSKSLWRHQYHAAVSDGRRQTEDARQPRSRGPLPSGDSCRPRATSRSPSGSSRTSHRGSGHRPDRHQPGLRGTAGVRRRAAPARTTPDLAGAVHQMDAGPSGRRQPKTWAHELRGICLSGDVGHPGARFSGQLLGGGPRRGSLDNDTVIMRWWSGQRSSILPLAPGQAGSLSKTRNHHLPPSESSNDSGRRWEDPWWIR